MSIPHAAFAGVVGAIVHNPLWLPGHCPVFETYTIAGGQKLQAGSVLGRVTATGKLKLVAAAAGDGSETPIAILPENVATYAADGTTAQDTSAPVAVHAYVNENALVVGAGYTIATVKPLLHTAGIFTRAPGYSG